MSVLTPGGNGEDVSDLTHKGSAADFWLGETDDEKASLETGASVSSVSPLSGDTRTAPVSPNFPYSSEVDYQSDPADFFPLVSRYPLAKTKTKHA